MNAQIAISITYKLVDHSEWQTTHFEPELFLDLEPGEPAEIDSLLKHNDPIDYLDVDPAGIQYMVLTIKNAETGASRVISETFWNGGKNRITEINVKNGAATSYSELIVETAADNQPHVTEIVRAKKQQGPWTLAFHVFITRNPDGTEMQTKVYPLEPT